MFWLEPFCGSLEKFGPARYWKSGDLCHDTFILTYQLFLETPCTVTALPGWLPLHVPLTVHLRSSFLHVLLQATLLDIIPPVITVGATDRQEVWFPLSVRASLYCPRLQGRHHSALCFQGKDSKHEIPWGRVLTMGLGYDSGLQVLKE